MLALVAGTLASVIKLNPDLMGCEARQIVLDTLASNLVSVGNALRQLDFGSAALRGLQMPAQSNTLNFTLRQGDSQQLTNLPSGTSMRVVGDPEGLISGSFVNGIGSVTVTGRMRQSVTTNTYPLALWFGSRANNQVTVRTKVIITVPAEGQ